MQRRHLALTKAQRQAEWLAQFNDALTTAYPALSGRVDWSAALYYFYAGMPVADAVSQYCLARNIATEEI